MSFDLKFLDDQQLQDLRIKLEQESETRKCRVRMHVGNVTREPDPNREPANTPLAVTMRDGVVQDRLVEFADGRSAWVGQ